MSRSKTRLPFPRLRSGGKCYLSALAVFIGLAAGWLLLASVTFNSGAAPPQSAIRAAAPAPTVTPLARETFTLTEESEVGLEITARAPGASWGRQGAEAAALKIEADGAYHQDLLLWAGDAPFTYRVLLGRMPAGGHVVSVSLNPQRSAAAAQRAEVISLKPIVFKPDRSSRDSSAEDSLAVSYAPILYARANSIDRFTDVPLLMYYEVKREGAEDTVITYTAIFTNEDGGTPTAALMARWGRATDIEWVYQIRLRGGGRAVVAETYQGVEHETKPFDGARVFGKHPLLAVASDNNNFSALACSGVRFALLPIRAQLDAASREKTMDDAPWTYRIMAEELERERRISNAPADAGTIADPREYLYVESYAEQQQGTALSIEVRVRDDAKIYSSDYGDARLRVTRSGYFRTATRLPPDFTPAQLDTVTMRCHSTTPQADTRLCDQVKLSKVFVLDRTYTPRELRLEERAPGGRLRPTEAVTFRVKL